MNLLVVDTLKKAAEKKISVLIVGPAGCGKASSAMEVEDLINVVFHIDRISVDEQFKWLNYIDNQGPIVATALTTDSIHPALADRFYVLHHPVPTVEELMAALPEDIEMEYKRDIAIAAAGSWRQLERLLDMPLSQSDVYLRNEVMLKYISAILNADLPTINTCVLQMRNLSLLPNAAISKMVDQIRDVSALKAGVSVDTFSGLRTLAETVTESQLKTLLDLAWAGLSKVAPLGSNYAVLWLMGVKAIEVMHGLKFDAQLLKSISDF